MNKWKLIAAGFTAMIILSGSVPVKKSVFIFKPDSDGVALSEEGKPVFYYRKTPKPANNVMAFNNYLHPVYNLKGEVITEEFPPDHLHHRGIFWAWHQLYINDLNLGDQWMMEKISQDVVKTTAIARDNDATLKVVVLWKSAMWNNGKPFIEEKTSMKVHRREANMRIIDFEIVLKPLVKGVQIGGSDDEKGYGGFSVRIKLPEGTVFTSEKGRVTPQNLQIMSGPWMDISALQNGDPGKSGLTILCHQSSPDYPEPWILRQTASMQNPVFPGRKRVSLEKPVTLRYRVIIHNGDAGSIDIPKLQSEYNGLNKGK